MADTATSVASAASAIARGPRRLEVHVASEDALDVRHFSVGERMNTLFEVSIVAVSENPDIDFEAVVGRPMTFTMRSGLGERTWSGLSSSLQQVAVEERGLSTYRLTLVPLLWLTTQRRNHRMFQLLSERDIVEKLLSEWGIEPDEKLFAAYKKRKYRVQYGESDFTFICRMLEDAGISFYFDTEGGASALVLSDAPQSGAERAPLPFRDNPTETAREHATAIRIERRIRPGKYTLRDHDYRRSPSFNLAATAAGGQGVEERLEQFHYTPGAFLFESDKGDATPIADDKGKYRIDERESALLAQRRLDAKRATAKVVTFETNALDPAPGTVLSFLDHPKSDLAPGKRLLVVSCDIEGTNDGEWTHRCEAVSADQPYRPPLATPKPKTSGVESATVVGAAGEEIHTDEFGRVRVHFHWDRESRMDDASSCWIHVSQPWGGAGFGGSALPRVGQEVIVDFLSGDPDRPVVVGRVYTNLQKTPYKLPDNKTQSGLKSNSTTGTGGYNEMMFEDAVGRELLRMQAEKDLTKLVKHDESVTIGNDRTKQIGHDDTHDVGHDRTRSVGNDEAVTVGHDETRVVANDRTRTVGNNEALTVGNNRSRTVGGNEDASVALNQSRFVGVDRSSQVGGSQKEQIGGSASTSVGRSMTVKVALMKNEMVGIASTETVGITKALTVGMAYKVTVGGSMSVSVGRSETETVGTTKKVTVGDAYDLVCGASTIHVDSGGNVTITAANVAVQSSGPVLVEAGGTVKVQAGGPIKVQGATVDIN